MDQIVGKSGLVALCVLVVLSACGGKDPPAPGNTLGGNSGSGGARPGGSGGQGTGGQSGGVGGAGGQSSGNGGNSGNGGSSGSDAAAPGGGSSDYFPFTVGNSWEYDVTETGVTPYKKVH